MMLQVIDEDWIGWLLARPVQLKSGKDPRTRDVLGLRLAALKTRGPLRIRWSAEASIPNCRRTTQPKTLQKDEITATLR